MRDRLLAGGMTVSRTAFGEEELVSISKSRVRKGVWLHLDSNSGE